MLVLSSDYKKGSQVKEFFEKLRKKLQLREETVLLFDYDGTLSPTVANADDAKPDPEAAKYLLALHRACPI